MSFSAKARRAPLRIVTGAFVLNSGLGKLNVDEEHAKGVHGMAAGTYPFFGKVDPKLFVKGLGVGEIAIGGALLLPIVPPVVAGAALAAFSGGLLNMYWNTPGMHEEGSPRPTQQGTAIAKDVWMFGIGTALVADGILEPAHDKRVEVGAHVSERVSSRGRKARKARRKARKAGAKRVSQALDTAHDLQVEGGRRARKAAKKASKRAQKAQAEAQKRAGKQAAVAQKKAGKLEKKAGKQFAEIRSDVTPAVSDAASKARKNARDLADQYGPVVAEKARDAGKAARDLAEEYGPVVADKARDAGKAARDLAEEYGPVVADKARDAGKAASEAAHDLADDYGPVIADKAKDARHAARDAADRVQSAVR